MLPIAILCNMLNAEVFVYGPGGPAPVIKELAQEFSQKSGEKIIVTAGPASAWIEDAKKNANIIFSGNSSMMDSFIKLMPTKLNARAINVLNVRPSGIVVRSDNPKKITQFSDLLKADTHVMVVDGAGQVGLYEDMALKNGDSTTLAKLRKNITFYAPNSKIAVERWNSDKSIDALIIWPHWVHAIGKDAKFIKLGDENVIYRASEIVLTEDSLQNKVAREFVEFVQSKDAQKVWKKHGWIAK
ncbi:hypothetical protein CCZ01_03810 [Helicobacter monodelphidis]|uniref:substrate-binding domain-containing protein n=1 Tax=Helicobacter sp. 15-1451 TaxID=2004995 RepID=UPI000DCC0CAE|nr:hypothetical protein CCZ01_03810 [Helicobacter sp. 15-1451]